MDSKIIHSPTEETTLKVAAELGRLLPPGSAVGLKGPLGAGKTCFVRGLAKGLGIPAQISVSSPTYTFIHFYGGPVPLHHIDLYRVEDEADLATIGVEEAFAEHGVTAVEWYDRFPGVMPRSYLEIEIEPADSGRVLRLGGPGRAWKEILCRLI